MHSHEHVHTPNNFGRIFFIGVSLNLLFILIEVIYGIRANSMALVADAGHNFGDVLSLIFSWMAYVFAKRKPTKRYTYGLRRTTILVALLNSIILLVSLGVIGVEAVNHFRQGEAVSSNIIIIVALVGVVINTLTALGFYKDRDKDLNIKSAFLHMAVDAAISVGVVLSGIVIYYTAWNWLDSVISLAIILIVLTSTWKLFVESIDFAMDAVPKSIEFTKVFEYLESIAGVEEVHDLHIWGVSTTEIALTVHLVMPKENQDEQFIFKLSDDLHHKFGIEHSTIQVERTFPGKDHLKGF